MRLCRFLTEDGVNCGVIESLSGNDVIYQIAVPDPNDPLCMDNVAPTLTHLPLESTKLLAPVNPSKIVCVGRNYKEHAKELGNPIPAELLIFLKPPSSVIGPNENIVRPKVTNRLDYEGELGVVIGRTCHKIAEDHDVRKYIRGYTCVNDVTARDLQQGQWTRAKGFDTFCPIGPFISDSVDPWKGVTVETRVNGEVRQHGSTADFIFSLDHIVRFISNVMTLYPGDVIATGTPSGVASVVAGDVVEVSIPGVGTLRNPVVDEP
ncbi:MAG: fumarylacetoacetate hydrolase family protein [Acidobacteriaceae bacterium]|nr:fumarylacetoacetate hydrolase family protein [Acidobacteriaceae bacterium]